VVLHLFGVPAAADAEQKPAARDLIDRGDLLGGLDRVALNYQTDPGADLEPLCRRRGGGQRDKGIHHVVIALGEPAAARRGWAPPRPSSLAGKGDYEGEVEITT